VGSCLGDYFLQTDKERQKRSASVAFEQRFGYFVIRDFLGKFL